MRNGIPAWGRGSRAGRDVCRCRPGSGYRRPQGADDARQGQGQTGPTELTGDFAPHDGIAARVLKWQQPLEGALGLVAAEDVSEARQRQELAIVDCWPAQRKVEVDGQAEQ